MADTKLSELTELAATPATDDEIYIRDISEEAATESKRVTIANFLGTGVELGGANGIAITDGREMSRGVDNVFIRIRGGTVAAGKGATFTFYGVDSAAETGQFRITTPDAAGNTDTIRLTVTGKVATAEAIWSSTKVIHGTSIDSAAVADQVSIGGYEIGAGHRALAISSEEVVVASAEAVSHYLPIRINGVTYGMLLQVAI